VRVITILKLTRCTNALHKCVCRPTRSPRGSNNHHLRGGYTHASVDAEGARTLSRRANCAPGILHAQTRTEHPPQLSGSTRTSGAGQCTPSLSSTTVPQCLTASSRRRKADGCALAPRMLTLTLMRKLCAIADVDVDVLTLLIVCASPDVDVDVLTLMC
jgi:hypothetical protein